MKVILTENVKGIGKKLDVVNVSDGYARNYLLPKKLAKIADNKSVAENTNKKDSIKYKQDKEKEAALNLKERLEKIVIEFRMKTSDSGKLFGSVTSKEISEELLKRQFSIDKKKIVMNDSVKSSGMYIAKIRLYEGIVADLKVKVIGI